MAEIALWLIPQSNCGYKTRNAHNISHIIMKHLLFKNPYFPSTIIELNKLDSNIWSLETLNIFKSEILKSIRSTANSIYSCHNPIEVKLLTALRLGLSHTRNLNTVLKIHLMHYPCVNTFSIVILIKQERAKTKIHKTVIRCTAM